MTSNVRGEKRLLEEKKSFLCIQSYYTKFKNFVQLLNPLFLLRIQRFHAGSKVITPDPKFLLRIQSFHTGSKVITPDPKL